MVDETARRGPYLVALGTLLVLLAACGSPNSSTVGAVAATSTAAGEPAPAPGTPTDQASATVAAEASGSAGAPEADPPAAPGPAQQLPDLVGKGLQVAQNRLQDSGFRRMTSHDALGRSRVQLLDREWKVCFQTPTGRHPTGTKVDLGSVRLDEKCPGSDQGDDAVPAGNTMPELRGRSAAAAVDALGTDASVTWRDGTGEDRTVLLPSNWKVCAQTPRPRARYDGVPVTLTVVKYGEAC